MINRRKVVVVGAGAVGATFSYALAQSGLADEIVLIDRNEQLVQGQVLDLVHGQAFFPTVAIRGGDRTDYADAEVIVITAGAAQRQGESRLELCQRNAVIMRAIIADVVVEQSTAVVVVVSNPVDVMTQVAIACTDWPRGRVFGSGTVLDSARLRHQLSHYCGVDVHNVHAYVLGEHGDSEFAAWSMTHVGGMPIDLYSPACGGGDDWLADRDRIEQQVRDSAYHIIGYKGATCFAVGLALVRIIGAVMRGENTLMTVSTLLNGEFGLRGVCLSVPCLVSGQGVAKIVESRLPEREQSALQASAATLAQVVAQVGI